LCSNPWSNLGVAVVLTLLHVPHAVLAGVISRYVLAAMIRFTVGDVVVVCAGWSASAAVPALAKLLAGRRVEAVLADDEHGELGGRDRALIWQMLRDGVVPVVCTRDHATATQANWLWLAPARVVVLPVRPPPGRPLDVVD
jgi:hypothetical protein